MSLLLVVLADIAFAMESDPLAMVESELTLPLSKRASTAAFVDAFCGFLLACQHSYDVCLVAGLCQLGLQTAQVFDFPEAFIAYSCLIVGTDEVSAAESENDLSLRLLSRASLTMAIVSGCFQTAIVWLAEIHLVICAGLFLRLVIL